jgi:hypothetical protein
MTSVTPGRREIKKSLRTNFDPDLRWRLTRAKMRAEQASHLPQLFGGAELDRPIFVVGAPRSGTMLLYTILRTSSNLAHWRPTEAHEVWEADYHPMLRGWRSNVLEASDVEPKAAQRIKRSFFLLTGKSKRLIDKTPRNVLRIPFIDAIFPDARYVMLSRDGRDNVNSLINAWRSNRYKTYELPEPHEIPGVDPHWWKFVLYPGWEKDRRGPLETVAANQWIASNEHILSARADMPEERWTEIRYEDLVDKPEQETGRLMEWLDLDYEDSVRERAAATHTTPINTVTPPEQGKWRRENPEEIEAILPTIRSTMEKLGYAV